MTRLFSYILTVDDGAAPNPYWGTCTLVICKPRIRSAAQVGDWVVGLGSKNSPLGDIRGQVIYAMEVTAKMTMREYDAYTRAHLPGKIPEASSEDWKRRLGVSIYDYGFSVRRPAIRPGVHNGAIAPGISVAGTPCSRTTFSTLGTGRNHCHRSCGR